MFFIDSLLIHFKNTVIRLGYTVRQRLAKIRRLFNAQPVNLPGFTRQSAAYPEHVRWTHAGALFVAINVPGSNNNLGRTPGMDAEYATRMRAVFAWLDEAVAAAGSPDIETLVVMMQANPDFERQHERNPDGYAGLRARLEEIAQKLGKPLVVTHGDTHRYKHDRPVASAPGLIRIEVDGWPWMGWVKAQTTPEIAQPVKAERRLYQ